MRSSGNCVRFHPVELLTIVEGDLWTATRVSPSSIVQAQRGAHTRFHHSESPTATETSNPAAPANHEPRTPSFLDRLRAARGVPRRQWRSRGEGGSSTAFSATSSTSGAERRDPPAGPTSIPRTSAWPPLLEVQQLGPRCKDAPFCRTIFTTNFDTLLQNALHQSQPRRLNSNTKRTPTVSISTSTAG
jgi:hypothetical protein